MSNIKRFNVSGEEHESENGDYCLWFDVEEIIKDRDSLLREVEEARMLISDIHDQTRRR